MEFPIDLYNRFTEDDMQILSVENVLETGSDKVVLQKDDQMLIESGVATAQYLSRLVQVGLFHKFDVNIEALQQLKSSHNPTSRLNNWNTVIRELAKLGIQVSQDQRSLMVAGDSDTIAEILFRVYQMELEAGLAKESDNERYDRIMGPDEREKGGGLDGDFGLTNNAQSPSKISIMSKEVKPEQPISILQLNDKRPLNETKTTLEFVIVSLCQALGISPSQSAGLLTDHNYYLMHACVKGVKGDHSGILKWYQLLFDSSQHLIDLAVESLPMPEEEHGGTLNDSMIKEEDTQPLFVLLGALKCGFFSENFQVSDWAFKLFWKISSSLNNFGYQKVFKRWMLQKPESENGKLGGGLEATLFMLNKHSQIVESVALLLISSFQGCFDQLIPEIQANHVQSQTQLYTLINDLLPFLHKHHKREIVQSVILDNCLIEDLLKHIDTKENALKSSCLSLLAEIWSLEPSLISDHPKGRSLSSMTKTGISSANTTTTGENAILDSTLRAFKNTCKFGTKVLKLQCFGLMFKLLDQFASTRNNQAPVIYKFLTFTLVENIQDDDLREFLMVRFLQIFSAHKTIPVSILAEPLLRILALPIENRFHLNVFDYNFFKMLTNHPKLQQSPLGLQLLDQFAKVILNDQLWAGAAQISFMTLASRFKDDYNIQEFLLKFSTLAINAVLSLNKQNPPFTNPAVNSGKGQVFHVKQSKVVPNSGKTTHTVQNAQQAYQEQEIHRRIKLSMIIGTVEKILNLRAPQLEERSLNDHIRDQILATNHTYKQQHGHWSKGLLHLLEFFHTFDAIQVMEEYEKSLLPPPEEEDIETLNQSGVAVSHHIKEERERYIIRDDSSERHDMDDLVADTNSINNDEYFRILPSDTRNSEISSAAIHNINNQSVLSGQNQRQNSHQGARQLVPYKPPAIKIQQQQLPPRNKVDVLAHRHIEAIKNKRETQAVKQQIDEEKRKLIMEKNIKKAKEEVVKRRIQLGVTKGSQADNENQLVLYEAQPTIEIDSINPKRLSLPNEQPKTNDFKLIDLDNEEEDRDRDGAKILLSKYSKVFKFLFNKYAMSRAQSQKIDNFQAFADKQINVAEICKMLRDHELLAPLTQPVIVNNSDFENAYQKISKDQAAHLVRLVNIKNLKKQDTSSMPYGSFIDLIPQLANLVYSKTLPHLSLPEMQLKLILHMEKATKMKGQSSILYEDPEISTIGDQEMLKEMNRRIKENPDFILPEGYYKVQEKDQVFRYQLPEYLPIKESQRIAIEVLDQMFFDKLGFHILEALVTYEPRLKVRPRIKHKGGSVGKSESNSALSYMKPIERKQLSRDQSSQKIGRSELPPLITPSGSKPIVIENKANQFIRPKLGIELKFQVIALQKSVTTPGEKNNIQETAEVLEEILSLLEKDGPLPERLPERKKVGEKEQIKNKAKEDRETKQKEDEMLEKQREEMRKKRHAKLQEEIEKKKQEKLKLDEEQKAKLEEVEKEKKDKERKDKSALRQKLDQKRQALEEAKKAKLDEKEAKQKEEEAKKEAEKQAKAKEHKEFFKKQKQQLEEEFQKRRQIQTEAEKIKKEMEDIKRQQADSVKSKMVNFMKQNKDQLRNEQAEWQGIQAFYDDPEVQGIFQKYEKAFGIMFRHYAAMDKKEMGLHSLQRINFNEFTKFGFMTRIVPRVIPNDDIIFIFRAVIRERTATLTDKEIDMLGLGVNSLGLDDFKKALIRIAIFGQNRLPEGQQLENVLLELKNAPDAKIATAQAPPLAVPRVQKNIRIRGRSSMNSGASNRQNKGMTKQTSQGAIPSGEQSNPKLLSSEGGDVGAEQVSQTPQPGLTPAGTQSKRASLAPQRKTKEEKLVEELRQARERQIKLANIKIEDKHMTKPFDVSIINPRTIEALIQFLNLQPNQHKEKGVTNEDEEGLARAEDDGAAAYADGAYEYNNEYQPGDDDGQQASQSYHDFQGNEGADNAGIEGVDPEDLENNNGYTDNIIGPNGEKEDWRIEG